MDNCDGAGTTFNITKYSFLHEDISPGRYLYKLSKVDFEGELSVDGYVELIAFAPNLFPNPTHANLSFYQQEMLTNLSIQIFDLSGKRVLSFDETQIRKNTLGFKIDVSVLSGGIYFAQIQADELERMEKFVIEK